MEERVEDREIQVFHQSAAVASNSRGGGDARSNANNFLAQMEKRKQGGDTEMRDEAENESAAAATSMIDTTGGASGGVKIGSNNPAAMGGEVDITEEDERRGALAFLAEQEKKSKFRDRRAIQLEAVKR